jgi:thymidylate synthase (FAD)
MNDRQVSQEVRLLGYTPQPLKVVYSAARTCYSEDNALEMFDKNISEETMLKLVNKILGYGHESIIEHFYLNFAISGVSRTLSHQHVRHRHATFSQKSQRYVTYRTPFKYIVPPKINPDKIYTLNAESHPTLALSYNELMGIIQDFYGKMLDDGIPGEDARYIFPNACETSYIFSCNFRELMYISNLRLCSKAQWEIRSLVGKLCNLVMFEEPWTTKFLVPKCGKYLQCKEKDPCKMIEVFLSRLEASNG